MSAKRWLPKHVTHCPDRHGKDRYRYRRGKVQGYLPGDVGSSEWLEALAAFNAQAEPEMTGAKSAVKVREKSMDALWQSYKQTPKWERIAAVTQKNTRSIVTRFLEKTDTKGKRYGELSAVTCPPMALNKILAGMAETPAAANNLRERLIALFDHAALLGWRSDNPARLTDGYRKGAGYHTWTDEEIEAWRAHYPNGTKARLVMELALCTAARKISLVKIERCHVIDGRIEIQHAKGGDLTRVRISRELQAAMDAMTTAPFKYVLQNEYGQPFTVAGLGTRFQEWRNAAGLHHCSLHGLRKARARQLAEAGATDAMGMAHLGQRESKTFAHYRAAADRFDLADNASDLLDAHLHKK